MCVETDKRERYRKIYNKNLRADGSLKPSTKAKYSDNFAVGQLQRECAHFFKDLKWGANGNSIWAHCTECALKSVCSYSQGSREVYALTSVVRDERYKQLTRAARRLYEKALDKAQIELDTFKDNDKTHVVVNYIHMQPGQIMTDTGCRASVGGEEWHRELTELIESFGLGEKIVEIAQEEAFKFGDGKAVVSRARRVYPVGIRGRLYMLSVSVVPNNCPGLMSYEQLEQLEGVISLKDRKVELLGEWGSLDMSSSGHPLIKLTEYPPHVRTAVAMNMEATQVYVTSVSSSDEEGYETRKKVLKMNNQRNLMLKPTFQMKP